MRLVKLLIISLTLAVVIFSNLSLNAEELWTEDFNYALKLSESTGKPILINFTGSDWCRWCFKLKEEVFSKKEFVKYAKDNLILFKADFPQNIKQTEELIKQNQSLQKKYQIKGYPTIVLIDKNQEVINKTGYKPGGVNEYIKHLEELLK